MSTIRASLILLGASFVVLAVTLVLLALGGQHTLAQGGIFYVDADATAGVNDGSSWDDAFVDLQPALDAAQADDEIWVAEGTYKPTAEHGGSGDRYRSFQMKNGVALYGGFDPTVGDIAWEDRDWEADVTILSGDIGTEGDSSDNSYHVFYHPDGTDLDGTAILDGFTISGGNANADDPHNLGGGMYNDHSSPAVNNCTFSGNSTSTGGGGMYNEGSSPTLSNCIFSSNGTEFGFGNGGAGMYNEGSSPTLTDCTFSGNWADTGGGMYNYQDSSPMLTDCTFSGNSASTRGGGMYNEGSSPTLSNCIFSSNFTEWGAGGAGMYNEGSSPTLTNCTFSGNSARQGGAMYNGGSTPTVINCILWGDSPEEIYNSDSTPGVSYSDIQGGHEGEGNISAAPLFMDPYNGDFHLGLGSPCIDVGNNDAPGLPLRDFEGDDRILNGDCDEVAIVDMGVDEVSATCVYLPVVLRNAP